MCVSEDSFQKLGLFFYPLGSSVRTQAGSLGDKCRDAITAESSPVPDNNTKVRERNSARVDRRKKKLTQPNPGVDGDQ